MKTLRLDEIEGIPVFGTLVWKPVRKTLGVTAFGINAYTAANAGDELVEDHTETQLGHEEIYAVVPSMRRSASTARKWMPRPEHSSTSTTSRNADTPSPWSRGRRCSRSAALT